MDATAGTLLGGRVIYSQPATGYRTGIEPVLLAAAVPARPGDRVLEAGTGAAAGLLCLTARVPGLTGLGIELDPTMAALARQNLADNFVPGILIDQAALESWHGHAVFDHAFANPPWHDPAGTPSPNPLRQLAKAAATLEHWVATIAAALRPGGSATLIVPAAQTTTLLAAMRAAGLGRRTIAPLWPKPGRPAKLVLIQALRGRRDPDRLTPGLVLHHAAGAFTPQAEAILRSGQPWPLEPTGTPAAAPPPPSCPPPARSS